MPNLYVLGGKQRRPGLKEPTAQDEWFLYESALILEVDTDRGAVKTCVEYQSPPDVLAGDRPAAHFHSGALIGNTLHTCTATEVLVYRLPQFQQIGYISLPCFNDLHHVTPSSDGNLLVVSTGLEMVVKVTPDGEVLGEWNVLKENPWERFSRAIDYRKVATTKPHKAHANFVFELDGECWVTRFHQRDAICLSGSGHRIELGGECPHDGLLFGGGIHFTAVDGKIVTVDQRTLRVKNVLDLRQIQDRGDVKLPAWCRGLWIEDESRVWVGFTRIRKTRFQENVRWVKRTLHEGTLAKPTHIALFDVAEKKCLQEIELEPFGMNAVYGIFQADQKSVLTAHVGQSCNDELTAAPTLQPTNAPMFLDMSINV